MLEADLSAGKGVLWLKSPQPAPDGTLFLARYMGQGKADFQPGADIFVHVVFGPSGDRFRSARRARAGRVRGGDRRAPRSAAGAVGGRPRPHAGHTRVDTARLLTRGRFAAVDARGAVYVFHLRANRFSLAHAAGQEVTAISFSPGRENDLIIGLADNSIRVISSDTGNYFSEVLGERLYIVKILGKSLLRI